MPSDALTNDQRHCIRLLHHLGLRRLRLRGLLRLRLIDERRHRPRLGDARAGSLGAVLTDVAPTPIAIDGALGVTSIGR